MATGNIKLSALPTLATVTGATIFPVVDSGATQTVTGTVVKSFITNGDMTITGNVSPTTTNRYTLGTPTHKWADLYMGPNSISLEDTANSANVGTLTVTNGVLQINGANQLQVGQLKFVDNTIESTTGSIDIQIGVTSSSANLVLNRNVVLAAGKTFTVNGNIVSSPTYAQVWSNANITIASANTAYTVPLNNTGAHNLISLGTGASNSRIIINKTGTYNIQFSAQIRKTSNKLDSVYIWFRKNGVDMSDTNGVFTITQNADVIQGWNIVDTIATAGHYYEIAWASTDNTTTMPTIAANSAGFTMPASPSIIVTITPVGA